MISCGKEFKDICTTLVFSGVVCGRSWQSVSWLWGEELSRAVTGIPDWYTETEEARIHGVPESHAKST